MQTVPKPLNLLCSESYMKPSEYHNLKQYVQENSSISYIPLDSILSKLDTQNLRDLKHILKEFHEAGKEDSKNSSTSYYDGYDNGYADGQEDAKKPYIDEYN